MAEFRVPEDLWSTSIFPEGILEQWLAADGATVSEGQPLAAIRVNDALHDIMAPASGQLVRLAQQNGIVEPGSLIGHVSSQHHK